MENKLNWKEYIKCISQKFANGTGIIIKVRKSIKSETLFDLCNTLIFQIWWTAGANVHLHILHIFKNVCINHGVHPEHADSLYNALNIGRHSIILFMHALHNMGPSMFVYLHTSRCRTI